MIVRDERGRFASDKDVVKYEITVWDMSSGDILEKVWKATDRDLGDIEERWGKEPFTQIEIEVRA